MRILIISTNVVRWGGSEELWKNIAFEALKKGHEVMVSVYMHRPLPEAVAELKQKGILIHQRPFPSYFKGQRFTGRVLAEFKLRTGLDNTSLDWIKALNWKPECILISSGETFDYSITNDSFIIKYCRNNQVPYYMISQFNWEHDMDISEEFRKNRNLLSNGSNGHFFVSVRNYLNAKMQIASDINKARIICNPIKIKLEKGIEYPDSEKMKMATVARYQPYIKGQDLLLQTLSSEHFSSIDFELSFYGSGEDEYHIRNLISYYGLENKVFIRNQTSNILEVWRENQILILPSRAEGTSLSLLEAMYCGRTAIVTNAGDSALWIGNRGFIAESNSVESLHHTILNAFNNHSEWKGRGEKCRDFVKNNHIYNQEEQLVECISGSLKLNQVGYSPQQYLNMFQLTNSENKVL